MTTPPLFPPSPPDDPQTLVSVDWLFAHLKDHDLRVLDASWHMPDSGRNAVDEYQQDHIPGACFFDIDDISDPLSDLPHMVPSVERFISKVRALGIGDGQRVVIYDSHGIFSAPRAWWLCRLMGKNNVAVLDGGLPKWKEKGFPTNNLPPHVKDRHLTALKNTALVSDVTKVARASKLQTHQIIDARSPERFTGAVDEPRPGLRSGHIPGAKNLPFARLLNKDGTLRSTADLRRLFDGAGVDLSQPIITSCGSGLTAAILILALERIGHRNHALYDGSWVEWGRYDDLPLEKGT